MTHFVWKFALSTDQVQEVLMPKDAQILHFDRYGATGPELWALCDTQVPAAPRKLVIYGTGWPMLEQRHRYICTFREGPFVFHLFEVL